MIVFQYWELFLILAQWFSLNTSMLTLQFCTYTVINLFSLTVLTYVYKYSNIYCCFKIFFKALLNRFRSKKSNHLLNNIRRGPDVLHEQQPADFVWHLQPPQYKCPPIKKVGFFFIFIFFVTVLYKFTSDEHYLLCYFSLFLQMLYFFQISKQWCYVILQNINWIWKNKLYLRDGVQWLCDKIKFCYGDHGYL